MAKDIGKQLMTGFNEDLSEILTLIKHLQITKSIITD